jgi:hypothetical protein
MNNLPPGVTTSMLPGNMPEDAAWEKFCDWALEQLATLDTEDAYRAVKIGIAGVQAEQQDIARMLREARNDERMVMGMEHPLTAAAPDLLAKCGMALDVLLSDGYGETSHAVLALRAAIANARDA